MWQPLNLTIKYETTFLPCFLNFYNNAIIHIDFFKKVVMTVNILVVGKKEEFQKVRQLRLFQAASLAD